MNDIKEIVILSGKGGAGKTTFTASMAKLFSNIVIADTDVDASDMYILMQPQIKEKTQFQGGKIALIHNDSCTACGKCESLCRFDAIHHEDSIYNVNPLKCEGCGLCQLACPVGAIEMQPEIVGEWYISTTDYGPMVHAKLNPGAENSGNLVTMVKYQAKKLAQELERSIVLIDGPPGIGCPVTSSLSGSHLAVIVAEPSLSSLHDVERLYKIIHHFKVPAVMVINKSDMNQEVNEKIKNFADSHSIPIIGSIPLNMEIVNLQVQRLTPLDGTKATKEVFETIFEKLNQYIGAHL